MYIKLASLALLFAFSTASFSSDTNTTKWSKSGYFANDYSSIKLNVDTKTSIVNIAASISESMDFLYIYDENHNLMKTYTGDANDSFTVPSNTIIVYFNSVDSNEDGWFDISIENSSD